MEGSGGPTEVEVAPGITIESPVGLRVTGAQAIDSKAAAWEGSDLQVVVDEGPLADPLTLYEERPDALVTEETIGGRAARVVSFTLEDGAPFAAAHFSAENAAAAPLTISVTGRGEQGEDVPLQVLRSVRFT
jgi:hypothetical protein